MLVVCANVLGVAPAALALLAVSLSDLEYGLALALSDFNAGNDEDILEAVSKC